MKGKRERGGGGGGGVVNRGLGHFFGGRAENSVSTPPPHTTPHW